MTSAMTPAVLFDLGNTLAAYYRREEFQPILEQAMTGVRAELASRSLAALPYELALARALAENREAADHRVMPLPERLERVFGVSLAGRSSLSDALCRRFLEPVFATGHLYPDTVPVLDELRAAGHRIAIVSNAPWGSSPELWRDEVRRLGLAACVDCTVVCGDVGWRKPAPQLFRHAAARLGAACADCVFVGDDLEWDVAGSRAVGMRAVLIDRADLHLDHRGERVSDLRGVVELLQRGAAAVS